MHGLKTIVRLSLRDYSHERLLSACTILGLAAVLLRNILERRRELALLRAVGYGAGHFAVMVLAAGIPVLP